MDRTRLLSIVPERPARSRRGEPSSTHVARNRVERVQLATAEATDAFTVLGRWRFATRPVPPTRHTSGGCVTTLRRQSRSAASSPMPDLLVTGEDEADDLILTLKSAANERRILVKPRARIADSSVGVSLLARRTYRSPEPHTTRWQPGRRSGTTTRRGTNSSSTRPRPLSRMSRRKGRGGEGRADAGADDAEDLGGGDLLAAVQVLRDEVDQGAGGLGNGEDSQDRGEPDARGVEEHGFGGLVAGVGVEAAQVEGSGRRHRAARQPQHVHHSGSVAV